MSLWSLCVQASPSAWLEALMLVCFGLAWPCANLRMLRTRHAEGKGRLATALILCGYLAGALAKWLAVPPAVAVPPLFWLYALNAGSVALNLFLQIRFSRPAAAAVAAAAGLPARD
jgi:hypothetical protein